MAGLHLSIRASQEKPDGIWCDLPNTWLFQDFNEFLSGMLLVDVAEDPGLGVKRNQLVTNAVRRLVEARMVNWNGSTGTLKTTDLGSIAAKYYIRIASIEVFNEKFRPRMSEADVLTMLSHSTEVRWFHPPLSTSFLTFSWT